MNKLRDIVIDINRLGALSSTSVRMNRFILLSGESGLGKTYVSILCHYVYLMLTGHHLFDAFFRDKGLDDNYLQTMTAGQVEVEITKDELETWIKGNAATFIKYMLKSEHPADVVYHLPLKEKVLMKINRVQQGLQGNEICTARIQVEQSPSFSYTLGGEKVNPRNPFTAALQLYLQEEILGSSDALGINYVLPPGRGTVMTEGLEPKTGLYLQFKRQFDKLRESELEGRKGNANLEKSIADILDGRVYKKEGGVYYYSTRGDDIPISILNNEVAKAFYGVAFEKIKKYNATKDSAAELALKIDKIILDNQYVDWVKNTDLQNKIINDIEDVLFEFKDTNKIDITFDDIDFIIDESMKIAKRRYAK